MITIFVRNNTKKFYAKHSKVQNKSTIIDFHELKDFRC